MASATMPQQHETAVAFVQRLFGMERQGFVTLAFIPHGGGRVEHAHVPVGRWEIVGKEIAYRSATHNCYVAVALYATNARKIAGKMEHRSTAMIGHCRWLYADLDGARVPAGFTPPTILVETSPGRQQAWWRLTEPIGAAEAADLNRRIARACGIGNEAVDATRILRIPGTINRKAGRTDALVRTVGGTDAAIAPDIFRALPRPTYHYGDAVLNGPVTHVSASEQDLERGNDVLALNGAPPHLTERLAGANPSGDPSSDDFAAVCLLMEAGLTNSEAYAVFTHSSRGHALADRKGEHRVEYLMDHLITRARKKVAGTGNNDESAQASHKSAQADARSEGAAESAWTRFLVRRASVWSAIEHGIPAPEFLVPHILLRGKVTILFGGPEQGKTWVLLHAIREVLGAGGKVLFLDEESGLRDAAERFEALGFTADEDARLFYFPFAIEQSLDDLASAILEGVQREAFDLICCDSISKLFAAAGLDENSNSDATKLMRAWITPASHIHGAAFFGLDHTVKVEDDSRYSRGAGSKLADVDVQWHIEATVPPSRTSRGRLVMTKKKDRTASVPGTVRLLAGGDGAGNVRVEIESTSEREAPPIRARDKEVVIALFGTMNTGRRHGEWLALVGIPARTFNDVVRRLVEMKIVGKSGDLYYVTADGADWCGLSANANSHKAKSSAVSADAAPLSPVGGGGIRTNRNYGDAQKVSISPDVEEEESDGPLF